MSLFEESTREISKSTKVWRETKYEKASLSFVRSEIDIAGVNEIKKLADGRFNEQRNEVASLVAKYSSLENSHNQLKIVHEELQAEYKFEKSEHDGLKKTYQVVDELRNQFEKDLQQTVAKNKILNTDFNIMKKERFEFREKYIDIKRLLDFKVDKHEGNEKLLTSKIEQLKSTIDELQGEGIAEGEVVDSWIVKHDNVKRVSEDLQTQLLVLGEKKQNLHLKINDLEAKLEDAKSFSQSIKNKNTLSLDSSTQQSATIQSLTREVSNLKNKISCQDEDLLYAEKDKKN